MSTRRRTVLLLATAGALTSAGSADAATFCLGTPACPDGTAVTSLQQAFDKAKAETGPDRVEIGPGSFDAGVGTQIGDPIEIVGAGRDQTTLTSKVQSYVLGLTNGGSTVRDLALHTATDRPALDAAAPITAERLRITGTAALSGGSAVVLRNGGTIRDTQVDLGLGQHFRTTAIGLYPNPTTSTPHPVTIEDVDLTAQVGIEVQDSLAPVAIRRARVRGLYAGLQVVAPAPQVSVDGLAAHLAEHPGPGSAGAGVAVDGRAGASGPIGLDLRHATLVSRDQGGQGLRIWQYSGQPITVVAREVVAIGSRSWAPSAPGAGSAEADLEAYGYGSGPVNLTMDHSAWRDGATRLYFGGLKYDFRGRGNVDLNKSPLNLADLEGGNLRPAAGSALVDNGGADGAGGATDAGGAPRAQDGDGDGAAVRDIGAYEAAPGTSPAHVVPSHMTEPCLTAAACAHLIDQPPKVKLASATRRVLRGTATDDRRVVRVEVGVIRRAGGRCLTLSPAGRWLAARAGCAPRMLRATGTARWTLRLKRPLRPGRYDVVVRATDTNGGRGGAVSRRVRVR